jgi:hypothetical protein
MSKSTATTLKGPLRANEKRLHLRPTSPTFFRAVGSVPNAAFGWSEPGQTRFNKRLILPTVPSCSPRRAEETCTGGRSGRASGSPRSSAPDWPRCASTILRHTCAAFLISSGAEAKDVQAHLGHASITTTMGTYGHRFESRGRELADRLQSTWETRDTGTDGARLGHAAGSNVVKMRPDQDVS